MQHLGESERERASIVLELRLQQPQQTLAMVSHDHIVASVIHVHHQLDHEHCEKIEDVASTESLLCSDHQPRDDDEDQSWRIRASELRLDHPVINVAGPAPLPRQNQEHPQLYYGNSQNREPSLCCCNSAIVDHCLKALGTIPSSLSLPSPMNPLLHAFSLPFFLA